MEENTNICGHCSHFHSKKENYFTRMNTPRGFDGYCGNIPNGLKYNDVVKWCRVFKNKK